MTKKSITFQIDSELKEEAEKLFSEFGMSIEEASIVFIKQCLREKRIPFEIRLDIPKK